MNFLAHERYNPHIVNTHKDIHHFPLSLTTETRQLYKILSSDKCGKDSESIIPYVWCEARGDRVVFQFSQSIG